MAGMASFEEAKYVIGVDRAADDSTGDYGALAIIKRGEDGQPDELIATLTWEQARLVRDAVQEAEGKEGAKNISSFDVLKRMSEKSLDIRLATSENLVRMDTTHKGKDTNITIGVRGNVIGQIYNNDLHVCLLIWNKAQYKETKAEMAGAATQAREGE